MPCRAVVHSLATVICRAWLAIALFAWLAWPAAARAETTACTVLASLPASIGSAGTYCLEQDFSADFGYYAIAINTNDVVIDCNGHRIRQTDPAGAWGGIGSGVERNHVVVRNCVLEGFRNGIEMSTNTSAGNRTAVIAGNTIVRFRESGIIAWGSGLLIENNHIAQALGTESGGLVGIYLLSSDANGAGSVIRGNTITDFRPGAFASPNWTLGINVSNVRNTDIGHNTISALNARTGQCTWGIYGSGASGTRVGDNTILGVVQPVAPPVDGSQCAGVALYGTAEEQATNVCSDNVIGHFGTATFGCVAANTTVL